MKMGAKVVGDLQQKGKTSPIESVDDLDIINDTSTYVIDADTDKIFNNDTTSTSAGRWSGKNSSGDNLGFIRLNVNITKTVTCQIQSAFSSATDNPNSGIYYKTSERGKTFCYAGGSEYVSAPTTTRAIYEFPISPGTTFIEYGSDSNGSQSGLWSVWLDGIQLVPAPVLTFETDQDLLDGAFQPGDLVHEEGEQSCDLTLADPPNNTPDGQYYSWNAFNGSGMSQTGLFPTVEFFPPLNGKLEVNCNGGGFFHVNKSDNYITCPSNEWTTLSESGDVSSLDGDNGAGMWPLGQYVYYFKLNGEELVITPPNVVISVDGANKQMQLDGGDWQVGDVVENTEVHPVMIIPETSAITTLGRVLIILCKSRTFNLGKPSSSK